MIIFLAGAEAFVKLMKSVKPYSVLVSFYYINQQKNFNMADFEGMRVFVDSGGFTFRTKHKVDSVPESYIREYGEWIKENEDYIFAYANVDVLDVDESKKNMKILENEYGLSPLPVWHYGESYDILKEYCETYDYVCLGGFAGSGADRSVLEQRIVNTLRKARSYNEGVKLHVFGYTANFRKISTMAYSCDSTGWIGSKYGDISYFKNGEIERFYWKDNIPKLVALAREYELDENEVKKGKGKFLNEITVREWKKLQEYYERKEVGDMTERVGSFCCKICPVGVNCSDYDEEATECKLIKKKMESIVTDNVLEDTIKYVIEQRLERYIRARVFEDLEGGILDKHVTQLEDGIANLIEKYLKLKYPERYGNVKVIEKGVSKWDELLNALGEEK
jgi:hypothetical protein